jgi:hypothetical protein
VLSSDGIVHEVQFDTAEALLRHLARCLAAPPRPHGLR